MLCIRSRMKDYYLRTIHVGGHPPLLQTEQPSATLCGVVAASPPWKFADLWVCASPRRERALGSPVSGVWTGASSVLWKVAMVTLVCRRTGGKAAHPRDGVEIHPVRGWSGMSTGMVPGDFVGERLAGDKVGECLGRSMVRLNHVTRVQMTRYDI